MYARQLADAIETDSNPSSMGIKAIRQELESMGIDTKSFIEKSEFVNALLDARNERKARCADCGGVAGGGISLKTCKSCMLVEYCNADCQRNHWPSHKIECKRRAAELRDEALFKDPPPKEDCSICFLPMPGQLINCVSLPPATISSVPINDFANANEGLGKRMEEYFSCCGKSICQGCISSLNKSGNMWNCPYCNAEKMGKTDKEVVEDLMKRVEANDAGATYVLGSYHYHGQYGLHQDEKKATELWTQAAELGFSEAHKALGKMYHKRGDVKKAKFRYEAAAMAGDEDARFNLGYIEFTSGNAGRGLKHWTIAASSGSYSAMHSLRKLFEKGVVSRESINSTLIAYNKSCVEMRSEARDAAIRS